MTSEAIKLDLPANLDHLDAAQTAKHLDRAGFCVVPIHALEEDGCGKLPIGKAWGKQRRNIDDVCQAVEKVPGRGLGILLGPGRGPGPGVIDIEADSYAAMRSLRYKLYGRLPETFGWGSAKGPHLLFQWDDRLAGKKNSYRDPKTGVEFRLGTTGQLQSVVPPSLTSPKTRTIDGNDPRPDRRHWHGALILEKLPEPILDKLLKVIPDRPEEESVGDDTHLSKVYHERPGGRAIVRGEGRLDPDLEWAIVESQPSGPGQRNDCLLKFARLLSGIIPQGLSGSCLVRPHATLAHARLTLHHDEGLRDKLASVLVLHLAIHPTAAPFIRCLHRQGQDLRRGVLRPGQGRQQDRVAPSLGCRA